MNRELFIFFSCLLMLASPALAVTDGAVYEEVGEIVSHASDDV